MKQNRRKQKMKGNTYICSNEICPTLNEQAQRYSGVYEFTFDQSTV